jgi:peptide/nickel transport system substrate-binding protein
MARIRLGPVRLVLVAGLVSALLLAACTTGPAPDPHLSESPNLAGGVYRTEIEDFGLSGAFDPVGEYSPVAFALYSQLLLRTLVTYRHTAGVAGTTPVPDLATTTGEVSADGLTWTFTLKTVKWGPPVDRSITSTDIAYAFRRLDSRPLGAQYGFWFDGLIDGMDGPVKIMPSRISGIETPNDRTVVFHLRHPAGDFPDRLALPAAAPVPPEVAGCFAKAGDYGRDLVASGPYMVEGSDRVDASSCDALRPESGFDPTHRLTLIRNPNYDLTTDSRSDRSSYLDAVDIRIQSNSDTIIQDVAAGRIDGILYPANDLQQLDATHPPGTVKVRTFADASLRYLFMNLLVPPFDDVHVRRAVEFAMDRTGMVSAGRPALIGSPATHLFRPPLTGSNVPYDPYPRSLSAARAEMARSRYDRNHDGRCDDQACRFVRFNPYPQRPPWVNMTPYVVSALASIGIEARILEIQGPTSYNPSITPRNMQALGFGSGWTDFPDPIGIAKSLSSTQIICLGQTNFSEVGMTRSQMYACHLPATLNYSDGRHTDRRPIRVPPSLDADITRCEALAGDARTACWNTFDRHVMEDIVPWVPIAWRNDLTVTGPTVVGKTLTLDQFTGLISLCHLAVSNRATAPA